MNQILKDGKLEDILEDIRVARFKWNPINLPKNNFYVVKQN